jgi:hypothetical protein
MDLETVWDEVAEDEHVDMLGEDEGVTDVVPENVCVCDKEPERERLDDLVSESDNECVGVNENDDECDNEAVVVSDHVSDVLYDDVVDAVLVKEDVHEAERVLDDEREQVNESVWVGVSVNDRESETVTDNVREVMLKVVVSDEHETEDDKVDDKEGEIVFVIVCENERLMEYKRVNDNEDDRVSETL